MSQSILERDYTENTPAPKNHAPSTGLTSEQAAEILKKHGPNTLATERKAKPLRIFMGQFKDVMVMILIMTCQDRLKTGDGLVTIDFCALNPKKGI